MQVVLRIEGHLREYFPRFQRPTAIELDGPATVEAVLTAASIPPTLPNSILLDGRRVELDHIVHGGEELVLLSPLSGG